MSEALNSPVLSVLARIAPGTPLREGLERILRGHTGALVVLGNTREVQALCTGGFALDVPYTPTALRELAKMDGAIVVEGSDLHIVRAGVHLMPDPGTETVETGTRHRTAERVARQTGTAVVSVSASMSTISVYLGEFRRVLERPDQLLARANQALATLERYRSRLTQLEHRLSSLEIRDQVTVRDVALLVQRVEMVRRLDSELAEDVVALGTDGRLLTLQLSELGSGMAELGHLLEQDYGSDDGPDFGFARLADLDTVGLADPLLVARTIGFAEEQLDSRVTPRGHRQVAQIPRLPTALGVRLIEHFGSLQELLGATAADLQAVDAVGTQRARLIRDGLIQLTESAYTEPVS